MSVNVRPSRSSLPPWERGDGNVEPSTHDVFGRVQTADVPFSPGHATERPNRDPRDDRHPRGRRRHAAPTRSQKLVTSHGARFTRFSVIGGVIFVAGLALQAGLTGVLHVPSFLSYVVQAVVSIEASLLLNRWYTWDQRATAFWPALLRFNMQKTVTVATNLVLYAGLLKLGVNYLLANVLLTALFTVINYVGGDRFVFTPGRTELKFRRPACSACRPSPSVRYLQPSCRRSVWSSLARRTRRRSGPRSIR